MFCDIFFIICWAIYCNKKFKQVELKIDQKYAKYELKLDQKYAGIDSYCYAVIDADANSLMAFVFNIRIANFQHKDQKSKTICERYRYT